MERRTSDHPQRERQALGEHCEPVPADLDAVVERYRIRRAKASKFSDEQAEAICDLLAEGWSLTEVCKLPGMPSEAVVRLWILQDDGGKADGMAAYYTRARQVQALGWADDLIEIADDARNDWMERNDPDNPGWQANHEHINRSKLRIDTRRFLLAKMLPKVYGDTTDKGKGGTSFVFNFPANATAAQMQAVANLAKSGMTPQALPGAPIDVAAKPKV